MDISQLLNNINDKKENEIKNSIIKNILYIKQMKK